MLSVAAVIAQLAEHLALSSQGYWFDSLAAGGRGVAIS